MRVETTRPMEDVPVIELWQIGKLAVLAYIVLALQASIIGQLQTRWWHLDLTPIVIALVGLRLGVIPGALFGTALGWFSVLLLGEPTGLPVVIGLAVGTLAGLSREELMVDVWPVRYLAVFLFAVLAEAMLAGGSSLLLDPGLVALPPLTLVLALPLIPVMDWLVRLFTRET